jgi:transposase-like protein
MNPVVEALRVIVSDTSKSVKIRKLYSLGADVALIARVLGISYNFAYNVIAEHKKRGDEK